MFQLSILPCGKSDFFFFIKTSWHSPYSNILKLSLHYQLGTVCVCVYMCVCFESVCVNCFAVDLHRHNFQAWFPNLYFMCFHFFFLSQNLLCFKYYSTHMFTKTKQKKNQEETHREMIQFSYFRISNIVQVYYQHGKMKNAVD